jgi:hypothetical protein
MQPGRDRATDGGYPGPVQDTVVIRRMRARRLIGTQASHRKPNRYCGSGIRFVAMISSSYQV